MITFSLFFSFQFQIWLSMSNCGSFRSFLTFIIFIFWIFKIDKLHLIFCSFVCLLNQFSWFLNNWLFFFLFLRNSRFDFGILFWFDFLCWLDSLHWLYRLRLTSSSFWLSVHIDWLYFSNFFDNNLIGCRSWRLWLDSNNLYLTWNLCICFLSRFDNFDLFLLCISRWNWLLFNYFKLLRRISWLNSWLDNWFSIWFQFRLYRLWLWLILFLNSLSNRLCWSLRWLCDCLYRCCLSALLNLVLQLIKLFWSKTSSDCISLLRFQSIRLTTFNEAQGLLKSCLYLFLVRSCIRCLDWLWLSILNQWLPGWSEQFSRHSGLCSDWSRNSSCSCNRSWCSSATLWLIHIL